MSVRKVYDRVPMGFAWEDPMVRTKRRIARNKERVAAAKAGRAVVAAAARMAPAANVAVRGLQLGMGELKAVDTALAATAIDAASGVQLINGIGRGDDINQRNGREIVMKSIEVKFTLQVTPGTGTAQVHRVVLVYDRQTNGTALTWADVYGAGPTILSVRNLENRKRFKVLMDRTFNMGAAVVQTVGGHNFITDSFYRKMNHPVTFNAGNAGTVADITTGSLYLMFIGSNAAGATAGSIVAQARVRYEDK
ncbi:capsid [uncultured virus]|uniref:Capsid n=1 Tax=uncultured virus TaxID=340016 RepID=A0A2K9LS49_9VIRU|nr:capsid [uncultured virus]